MFDWQSLSEIFRNKYLSESSTAPFSVIYCREQQQIHRVPIIKPTLIFVLKGHKTIGQKSEHLSQAGELIYLAAGQNVFLQNTPNEEEYLAVTLELELTDFDGVAGKQTDHGGYFTAGIDETLAFSLQQLLLWAEIANEDDLATRRTEIVRLLANRGYADLLVPQVKKSLSQQVSYLIQQMPAAVNVADVCHKLATSEASLRRKLQAEDTSFTELLDSVRLGRGLDLVQTTSLPIGLIAERCGYQSASRFSERFKHRFAITPSELRRTR